MKTLIIPDIHNKVDIVNDLLATAEYSKVVMLGDYFDSTESYDPEKVVHNIQEWATKSYITMLWGNHDIPYAYGIYPFGCSGYKEDTQNEIDEQVVQTMWNKFKLYTKIGDWYLSHAGMHPNMFCRALENNINDKYVDYLCDEAIEYAKLGKHHIVLGAGQRRGGHQQFGGITWLDFRMFKPIPNVNQIVGHTADKIIRWHNANWTNDKFERSLNVCLDTHLNHYAILENNKLSVYDMDGKHMNYSGEYIDPKFIKKLEE